MTLNLQPISYPQKTAGIQKFKQNCAANNNNNNNNKTTAATNLNALYPYNYNVIPFKSYSSLTVENLIKSNKSNNIYEFLNTNEKASPHEVKKFLTEILKDEALAYNFIKEITQNPRESCKITVNLMKKLGNTENFRNWYFSNGGYLDTFGKFLGEHIYTTSKTESEMLEYMPNWTIHKLREKSNAFGHEPIIGYLPGEFVSRENFVNLVDTIKSLHVGEKQEVNLNGKYLLEKLTEREKISCRVTHIDSNKKFIIKIDNLNSNSINDKIRANSVFLESTVGHYLTTHKCKNAAEFYYYDSINDAGIFEYVEGAVPEYKNSMIRNKELQDLMSLGIYTNDIEPENFRITADGTLKIIDLGHINYFDRLKPGDKGSTMDMPNCARPSFLLNYGPGIIENFVLES